MGLGSEDPEKSIPDPRSRGQISTGSLIRIRKNPKKSPCLIILTDFFSMYCIQHCFICSPSDSTVSEAAGIEPRTVATLALAVGRSNH
jgi:hypothetical protein